MSHLCNVFFIVVVYLVITTKHNVCLMTDFSMWVADQGINSTIILFLSYY